MYDVADLRHARLCLVNGIDARRHYGLRAIPAVFDNGAMSDIFARLFVGRGSRRVLRVQWAMFEWMHISVLLVWCALRLLSQHLHRSSRVAMNFQQFVISAVISLLYRLTF